MSLMFKFNFFLIKLVFDNFGMVFMSFFSTIGVGLPKMEQKNHCQRKESSTRPICIYFEY